jgi:hypothetical protein
LTNFHTQKGDAGGPPNTPRKFLPKFAIRLEIEIICHLNLFQHKSYCIFIGLPYQGKDIVFRFIIEYTSLTDFGPYVIKLFLYEDL